MGIDIAGIVDESFSMLINNKTVLIYIQFWRGKEERQEIAQIY